MEILRRISVPTGDILIVSGTHGKLECLSLGDYGKAINLNPTKPVHHTDTLPLNEKWVLTISSQYGCSMGCVFCDVPRVGSGRNATLLDLNQQVITALLLHPEVKSSRRLNIHFARMGEPTWNPNVLDCAKWLHEHINPEYRVHPVVSTMMPRRNQWLKTFIHAWMRIKNRLYDGEAGLQLSINSTDERERRLMFCDNACSLHEIHDILDGIIPVGRKITLNFAVAHWTINPQTLLEWFDPDRFVIKLTPVHKTSSASGGGRPMNLYRCEFKDADWMCLCVAETAKNLKATFWYYWRNGSERYIDIRVKLIEKDVPYEPGFYDGSPDEPEWTRDYFCVAEFEECHCRDCEAERKETEANND